MADMGDGVYASMLEEDRDLVDWSARNLARDRGISLD